MENDDDNHKDIDVDSDEDDDGEKIGFSISLVALIQTFLNVCSVLSARNQAKRTHLATCVLVCLWELISHY